MHFLSGLVLYAISPVLFSEVWELWILLGLFSYTIYTTIYFHTLIS
jgi:hypothetical protein